MKQQHRDTHETVPEEAVQMHRCIGHYWILKLALKG